MRVVAVPALLLLALAGLALVPDAAAAPPEPPCNGTIGASKTLGPVTVFASPPCYTVSVDPGCVYDHWYRQTVQRITVEANVCKGPTPPPTGASSAPPCTCPPPQCTPIETVGPLAGVARVSVSGTCDVRVDLLRIVACTEPLDGTWVFTRGRVTVTAPCKPDFDPCEPPFECYPQSTARAPPVCIWKEVAAGPVKAGFDQCQESHETDTCSNGSPQRIHRYEQVGPVYAQVHFCFPHSPPPGLGAAAEVQPPDPCGPTALCQGPECPAADVSTTDLLAYLGPHASASLSRDCHASAEERGLRCSIGTADVERTIGPLTVGADLCLPSLDCTCDPLPIATAPDIQ